MLLLLLLLLRLQQQQQEQRGRPEELLLLHVLGCMRSYHLEKKLHIHRISDIFLTSLSPSSAAGLVGLLLSIEGTGATSVTLWGPHGLKPLLQLAIRSFAGL